MASARSRQPQPSSELGDGDFAVARYSRTGRLLRKRRRISDQDSPFVDSAIAVSDPDEYDSPTAEYDEIVPVPRVRLPRSRRKRSPSPPMSEDMDLHDPASSSALTTHALFRDPPAATQPNQIIIKDLVIHLPPGHTGPVMLQLTNPTGAFSSHMTGGAVTQPTARGRTNGLKRGKANRNKRGLFSSPTSASPPRRAGFLDLPAELRNQIYREVLVTSTDLCFDAPSNFARGAAMLRTCRQVHDEGSSILYGENRFVFRRRSCRAGSYWASEWNEVGFRAVRRFLKNIGPAKTAMLRQVSLVLEDATPSHNPRHLSIEDRRFVNDGILISILRHLADYAQLEVIKLCFHGRRRVERSDSRFLDHLLEIQADKVVFERMQYHSSTWSLSSKQEQSTEHTCVQTMTRKVKMYDRGTN